MTLRPLILQHLMEVTILTVALGNCSVLIISDIIAALSYFIGWVLSKGWASPAVLLAGSSCTFKWIILCNHNLANNSLFPSNYTCSHVSRRKNIPSTIQYRSGHLGSLLSILNNYKHIHEVQTYKIIKSWACLLFGLCATNLHMQINFKNQMNTLPSFSSDCLLFVFYLFSPRQLKHVLFIKCLLLLKGSCRVCYTHISI